MARVGRPLAAHAERKAVMRQIKERVAGLPGLCCRIGRVEIEIIGHQVTLRSIHDQTPMVDPRSRLRASSGSRVER